MDGRSTESGVSAVVEYDYAAKEPDELDLVKGDIIHSIKQLAGGWWEGTLKSTAKTGMFPDNFVRVIDMSEDSSNVTLRDKAATSNRRCKVIYSYTQVNDDELSLGVGDVIEFLGEVEEGWWRGRLRSKVGVFPSNFVVAIEPSPVLASKRPPSSAPNALSAAAAHAGTTRTQLNATNSTASSAVSSSMSAAKKANRLSFHSSKEDLLSSGSATSTSSSSAHQQLQQQQQTHHSTTTATATTTLTTADDAAPSLPPKPQRAYCRVEFPYAPQNDDELDLKVGDIISVVDMELPDKGWWKGELRGKIGVFPDNFVKLITTASPLNDSLDGTSQKGGHVKITSTSSTAASSSSTNATHLATTTTTTSSSLVNNHHLNHNSASTNAKVMIKKSGSSSSTQSSNAAKENFGSRDSLNDILSETGLQTGNVAAQRRSLENKKLDLSQAAEDRLALKKQLQQHLSKSSTSSSSTTTTSETSKTVITSAQSSVTQATASTTATELRKSMESLDEKTKAAAAGPAAPPVLTKKPSVPSKKSTTVTSVAGNIISGLKQKVKHVENKLTTTVSHDYADGVASSRMSPGGVPEAGPAGNVVMRRAATIAVEDSEFDRIERSSMLTDMRAGRVKAPKRRPPSAAINVIGESNNNETLYVNGSNGSGSALDTSDPMSASDDNKMQSSDDNSTGEEHLAKPKPREWEKKKAPWMEELKASQVKKKTSPGTDASRLSTSASGGEGGAAPERSSRLSGDDLKAPAVASAATSATSKVQSPSVGSSASLMAQSMSGSTVVGGGEPAAAAVATQPAKRYGLKSVTERHSSEMTASATITTTSTTATAPAAAVSSNSAASATEDVRIRPSSLSIRNSRIAAASQPGSKSSESAALNNHNHLENNGTQAAPVKATPSTRTLCAAPAAAAAEENGVGRVSELERRIEKLESTVQTQQRTIDELVRTLREETDRVRVLRGELDKYAQCVTQV